MRKSSRYVRLLDAVQRTYQTSYVPLLCTTAPLSNSQSALGMPARTRSKNRAASHAAAPTEACAPHGSRPHHPVAGTAQQGPARVRRRTRAPSSSCPSPSSTGIQSVRRCVMSRLAEHTPQSESAIIQYMPSRSPEKPTETPSATPRHTYYTYTHILTALLRLPSPFAGAAVYTSSPRLAPVLFRARALRASTRRASPRSRSRSTTRRRRPRRRR